MFIQNLIFLASNGLTGETTSRTISSGLITISCRSIHFPKHFQPAKLDKFWWENSISSLFSGQNCMTYMEYRDVIFQNVRAPHFQLLLPRSQHFEALPSQPFSTSFHFPNFSGVHHFLTIIVQYRDYFWNDSDCKNDVAHYICVKVTFWKHLFHHPGKLFSQNVRATKRRYSPIWSSIKKTRYPSKCSRINFFRTVLTALSREQLPQSSFQRKNSLVLWSWCWLSVIVFQ